MYRKLNIITIIAGIVILSACSNETTPDKIKQQITEFKNSKAELDYKIDSLETILKNDTSMHEEIFKVPVVVKKIQSEKFNHYFEATGIIEAIEAAFISPEINGQIKSILIEEGDRVKKGQLLVILNTSLTQKGIEELKTGLELATKLYEKQKELWDKNIGSEIQFLQAKNNKVSLEKKLETLNAQLEMAKIRAPFDGIIDAVFQKVGELASPGRQTLQLINLSKIKIKADVSEEYISKIKKGDNVKVRFPSYSDYSINATIFRTGNTIHPLNRNFEIQLKIENKEEKLKPNMLTVLKINDYSTDKAFVVPSIVVKNDIKGEFVFVAKKSTKGYIAEKARIETGLSYIDKTVVLKGISENDLVIIQGYNMVTSGINVAFKK